MSETVAILILAVFGCIAITGVGVFVIRTMFKLANKDK
jgi:hypothetical protein